MTELDAEFAAHAALTALAKATRDLDRVYSRLPAAVRDRIDAIRLDVDDREIAAVLDLLEVREDERLSSARAA